MNENISFIQLAGVIKAAKKERVTKREVHRGNKRLGTLDEELDKIDLGRDMRDEIASRYVGKHPRA